jgi:hypothetical protein
MRKIVIVLCLAVIVIMASCSKSSTAPDPGTGAEFKFTSLAAADTVIKVNDITSVTAQATGDNLTYTWTASYGTFVGSGATVQWTVCHQAKFNISCVVTDKYNHSEKKTIVVRSHN